MGFHAWNNSDINSAVPFGFISALIDQLVQKFNVDEKRVYVTGMSNGALMSNRLACELADKIAAIAPVVGATNRDIDANEVIWNFFKRHAIIKER